MIALPRKGKDSMMKLIGADPYFVGIVAFGVVFMIVMLSWLYFFFAKKAKEERERNESKS